MSRKSFVAADFLKEMSRKSFWRAISSRQSFVELTHYLCYKGQRAYPIRRKVRGRISDWLYLCRR